MNIQDAKRIYNKAGEESGKAYKAYQAAKEAQEAARLTMRAYIENARPIDKNSADYQAYDAAQEATAAALKKYHTAAAVHKAAGENYLNVVTNTLRAAILESPANFSKPIHYKVFEKAVKDVTGDRFYIDNSYSCSFYIRCLDMVNGENSAFICEKTGDTININPDKLRNLEPEYTLQEIKKEAKKAEKDAEKMRAAAYKLEKLIKETRGNYNTYIRYLLPDYYSNSFHDSKLF